MICRVSLQSYFGLLLTRCVSEVALIDNGGIKFRYSYMKCDTGENRFLPKFVKNMGFIWKMFGTIVENRFSRKGITNQTFPEFGKMRFGNYLGNIWNHCLEIFQNSLVSSCLQLWNLFGNIITEIWNLIGVFMEIFRMAFGIFFVIRMVD